MANEHVIVDDEQSIKTISARERIRKQLNSDMANFLSSGGAITEVEVNVTADPPMKPGAKYGGRPI